MDGRYITVRGKGYFQAEPDCTVIILEMLTHAAEYENVARYAEERFDELCKTLCALGVARDTIITTNFMIDKNPEIARDPLGNYRYNLNGFICRHEVRIEMPFDMKKLSVVLLHISKIGATPDFPIIFSVKNNACVSEQILSRAASDAREKAMVLAHAGGVKLGKLVTVDYDLKDKYDAGRTELSPSENIEVQDTVSFVWDIE